MSVKRAVHMFVYPEKTDGQNHNKTKYVRVKGLLRTVLNKNCMREEIRSSLNSGNTGYHTLQNLLSFL